MAPGQSGVFRALSLNLDWRQRPGVACIALSAILVPLVLSVLGLFFPPGPLGKLPYGPVRMNISFPASPPARREPILSGGVKGASFLVAADYVDAGHIRFVYDFWGHGGAVSDPVPLDRGHFHQLTVDLPQLRPPTREAGVPLSIAVDGREIFRHEITYAPLAAKSLYTGEDAYPGPYPGRDSFSESDLRRTHFSGEIRNVERLQTPDSLPQGFLADRLFPNLRYELEVSPYTFYWSVLLGCLGAFATVFRNLTAGPEQSSFLRRSIWAMTPVAIAALPLVPALEVSRVFQSDWLNQGWMMEYYGHFLGHHFWPPRAINTQQIVGFAFPIFYGHFFYVIGGIFSSMLGGDLAIRICISAALLLQTVFVRRVFARVTGKPALGNIVAALVCWDIYHFSALYNRGAIAEYLGICFLTCAVCILLDLCFRDEARSAGRSVLGIALFYSLAASHPITAVFGALFLFLISATALAVTPKKRALAIPLVISGSLIAVILAPWAYMLAKYSQDLWVAKQSGTYDLVFFEFDNFFSRLAPFPFDSRSLIHGAMLQTSYADSQLNLPLLLMAACAGLFVQRERSNKPTERLAVALISAGWVIFTVGLSISVSPAIANFFGVLIKRFQFAYRLVAYQNLSLLVVGMGWAWLYRLRGRSSRAWFPSLCTALLAVGAVAMLEKWTHASAAPQQSAIGHSEQTALTVPYTYYSPLDYTGGMLDMTASGLPVQRASFQVLDGPRFGEMEPLMVDIDSPKLLVLNVSPLPVNRILVDGVSADLSSLRRYEINMALMVNPGRHRIEYRFDPGAIWLALRLISELTLLAVALTLVFRGLP